MQDVACSTIVILIPHPLTARGWLRVVGKPEAELAVNVQLASRSVSRRFERADEGPKVSVEALRVRRRRLDGDFLRILEGARLRKLTVQVAPGVSFGACQRRVRACIRLS